MENLGRLGKEVRHPGLWKQGGISTGRGRGGTRNESAEMGKGRDRRGMKSAGAWALGTRAVSWPGG